MSSFASSLPLPYTVAKSNPLELLFNLHSLLEHSVLDPQVASVTQKGPIGKRHR